MSGPQSAHDGPLPNTDTNTDTDPHPFASLTPEAVLDAVSGLGVDVDGRLHALSSYENRVYELCGNEGQGSVIAKFYRPKRWSREQILEEHDFVAELMAADVPMVGPLSVHASTLHEVRLESSERDVSEDQAGVPSAETFYMSLSPKRGGRWPELDDPDVLAWLGRLLARIHQVGERAPFASRPTLNCQSFGWEPRRWLLEDFSLPSECRDEWAQVSQTALHQVQEAMAKGVKHLRLHGDFHPGNILWTPSGPNTPGGPHFVDLDDARMGPAVQDLWMLLSGERADQTFGLSCLLEGYESLREFDRRELALIEPLRTLRLIHYSAWLAQRMADPAFVRAFDWFGSTSYWKDQIVVLTDQCERMQDPPLVV